MATETPDISSISPTAWELLRVAAQYSQREVEREIDEILQAHISMLEGGNRALSYDRRQTLFDLYTAELTDDQVSVIIRNF
ncbi:hypothetical protein [Halococcus sp. IIIV-5B]|uniref:hypothetical protein n=1 Tax=Halococcus sp. IIIV-5B TaxID=2321230 RepID=UPI000E710D6B|nr:hypothetical protein [Halococcus sp. IIIV-5B]RJT07051.1 hypothetical protein D3261_03250 [Halococcus sp. IIIV-5B]